MLTNYAGTLGTEDSQDSYFDRCLGEPESMLRGRVLGDIAPPDPTPSVAPPAPRYVIKPPLLAHACPAVQERVGGCR
jgi:hypothetical protein